MNKIFTIFLLSVIFLQTKAQIVISGVMYDPAGNDSYAENGVIHGLTKKGGFEYVQLMATEDINFALTNYAVVWCRNPGATVTSVANGWASGGDRTYQFSLTSGTVTKGEFFYVGGPEKTIAGYVYDATKVNPGVRTADISAAKWIKTIPYGSTAGDNGNGSATTGLIANSGNPTGVAVFSTANVTNATVPIDVVFVGPTTMGSGSKTAILVDGTTGPGYLVPKNDRYDPLGSTQLYAGVGTNTFCFAYQADATIGKVADFGNFLKLGGEYDLDSKTWVTPRTATYVQLVPSKDPAGVTYATTGVSLSTIESGGVTQVLPIKLSSFEAKKENSAVLLKWVTASEENNAYFKVLRSSDGKVFHEITRVNGSGKLNKAASYQFLDKQPLAGVNYYKLQQVDFDGKFSDSKVIYATIDFSDARISVSTHNGIIVNLSTPVSGSGSLTISDVQGRKIKNVNNQFAAGTNQVSVDAKLTSGLYVLTVQMNGQKLTSKFVVK